MIAFCILVYSNKFEVNFNKFGLIIICKHLEIYTKTISCLGLGDYKPTIDFAFGSVNIGW